MQQRRKHNKLLVNDADLASGKLGADGLKEYLEQTAAAKAKAAKVMPTKIILADRVTYKKK